MFTSSMQADQMKDLFKFWPFEVAEESERTPLSSWLPRMVIVGLISGFAGLIVLVSFHKI
jgi:hypothetical protein